MKLSVSLHSPSIVYLIEQLLYLQNMHYVYCEMKHITLCENPLVAVNTVHIYSIHVNEW